MDEGRHRGGAFHRIGKPQVERQLRALAARTDEAEQRDRRGGRLRKAGGSTVDGRVVERTDRPEGEEHRHHEAPVADAVGDERLLAGDGSALAFMPERDEQVAAGTHAFPTEEGDQHVRPQHQHQHAEREQVEVQEELAEPRIAVHVPDRIEVDERADAGDEEAHGDAERICQEREIDLQRTHRDPREQALHVFALFGRLRQQVEEHADSDREGRGNHQRGEEARPRIAELATEQQQTQEPRER